MNKIGENRFKHHILQRGYDYYCDDCIRNFVIEDGYITAVVEGTEEYEVEIELADDTPGEMHCTCPYAESGENCKHMAAVLFQWEELNSKDFSYKQPVVEYENIEEIIKRTDDNIIKKFLCDVLNSDMNLRNKFLCITGASSNENTLNNLKNAVDNTIDKHLRYEGYIDYYHAMEFIEDMADFYEDIEILIAGNRYVDAFDFSYYLCSEVESVDMDDSDGGLTNLLEEVYYFWLKISDDADDESKDIIFNKVKELINKPYAEYTNSYLESLLNYGFNDKKYLQEKLNRIDIEIEKLKYLNSDDMSDYRLQRLVINKLGIMEKAGVPFGDLELYCKENWDFAEIKEWLAKEYTNRKNYESAITVYEDIIESKQTSGGFIRNYRIELKNLYKTINDSENYRKQLYLLITKCDCNNLNHYQELRNLYTEEDWKNKREEIFMSMPDEFNLAPLYNEEKLYDRLLEVILNGNLSMLMRYTKDLSKLYPNEILDKYEIEINKLAKNTADRKTYQEWVRILKFMKQISGGDDKVEKIVSQWRITYKNRRALMDELKKL